MCTHRAQLRWRCTSWEEFDGCLTIAHSLAGYYIALGHPPLGQIFRRNYILNIEKKELRNVKVKFPKGRFFLIVLSLHFSSSFCLCLCSLSLWSRALVAWVSDPLIYRPIIIIIITILTNIIITSVSMKQSKGLIQWSSNLPANPPPAPVPPLFCARDRNRDVKVGKCKTSSGTLVFWRGLNDHSLQNVFNPRLTLVAA